jgi:hypothetical protein
MEQLNPMALQLAFPKDLSKDLRRLLAFGSGVGIEIRADALEVVAARVRPSKIEVVGRLVIENYAGRPAAEWGAEYARFLAALGMSHLAATVLLPRREVIVRQLAMPGVAAKDVEGGIRFQIDTLHPYGEDDVVWGWSPLAYGAVLVGIARRDAIERYRAVFTEAGIAVASFTFSAAAVHAAIRLNGAAGSGGFVALGRTASGAVEFTASQSRQCFRRSSDTPQRRRGAGAGGLRLPPDAKPDAKSSSQARRQPGENASPNALPYATALAGPVLLAPSANCCRRAPAVELAGDAGRRGARGVAADPGRWVVRVSGVGRPQYLAELQRNLRASAGGCAGADARPADRQGARANRCSTGFARRRGWTWTR